MNHDNATATGDCCSCFHNLVHLSGLSSLLDKAEIALCLPCENGARGAPSKHKISMFFSKCVRIYGIQFLKNRRDTPNPIACKTPPRFRIPHISTRGNPAYVIQFFALFCGKVRSDDEPHRSTLSASKITTPPGCLGGVVICYFYRVSTGKDLPTATTTRDHPARSEQHKSTRRGDGVAFDRKLKDISTIRARIITPVRTCII